MTCQFCGKKDVKSFAMVYNVLSDRICKDCEKDYMRFLKHQEEAAERLENARYYGL